MAVIRTNNSRNWDLGILDPVILTLIEKYYHYIQIPDCVIVLFVISLNMST